MKLTGRVIKGIGGFYYVDAACTLYECRARGVFRKQGRTPLVGDIVEIEPTDEEGVAYMMDIQPRKSELRRPAVANVDQALLIFACTKPSPSIGLIDRFLINMQQQEMDTIICISKCDLVSDEESDKLANIYKKAGYKVLKISNKTGEGVDELRAELSGKMTVLSGPSGVGKSSLIKGLLPDSNVEIGELSEKIGRGKNTTRHTEIIALGDGGTIIDTPGYSSIELLCQDEADIAMYMREFDSYLGQCRFIGCAHMAEPNCSIKAAVEAGEISSERYESYKEIYTSIKSRRKW